MRPHILSFTAIGSYPGTVSIDFDELSPFGLFHISGPTGAGKSSLLDALCFAIYGKVAAPRSTERLRSDHAPGATEARASLDFSVRGADYRITRTPYQYRPKKVGTGMTEKWPTAALLRRAGDEWLPVADNVKEVDAAMHELVGLEAEQFMQVVVLPQGAFAEALRANGKEREALLRSLFRTARFGSYTERLKATAETTREAHREAERETAHRLDRVNALSRELGLLEPEAAALDIAETEPHNLSRLVDHAARLRNEEASRLDQLRRESRAAAQTLQESLLLAERWTRKVGATNRLRDLDAQRDEMAQIETELLAAERATPVLDAMRIAGTARDAHSEALTLLRTLETDLTKQREQSGLGTEPTEPEALRAEVNQAILALEREREAFTAWMALRQDHDAALEQLAAAEVEQQKRTDELTAATTTRQQAETVLEQDRTSAAQSPMLRETVEAAQRRHDAARALPALLTQSEKLRDARLTADDHALRARHAHIELLERRLRSMAGELAANLQADEPCAVCGSAAHPRPASNEDVVAPSAIQSAQRLVETADVEQRTADAAFHEHEHLVSLRRNEAGSAATSPNSGKAELLTAQAQWAAAEAARERMTIAEAALRTGKAKEEELLDLLDAAKQKVLGFRAQCRSTEERLERMQPTEGLDIAALDARRAGLEQTQTLADRIANGRERVTVLAQQASTTRDEADAVRVRQGFAVDEELAGRARSEGQVAVLRTTLEDWRTARATAEATLADPDIRVLDDGPDLVRDQQRAEERQRELDTYVTWSAQREARTTELTQLCEQCARDLTRLQPLRAQRDRAQLLWNVCNGGGDRRISLERYVLAAYLEEVADAASVRLQSMSAGRYRLRHSDAVAKRKAASGLSLLIADAYTGQEREVSTLSGGETFLASLALALGLADVVQQHAGGVHIDALFVDEGFGSLDPETLDLAMSELDRLRAGGRLVGIISHVEALKDRIPVGLVVIKGADGSRVKVIGVEPAISA